jgi:DNA polymerase III sliding clamp (beta) subunit (PCNA family)
VTIKVTFETATLADAIKKADRVAPGKGKAFDEAGGIVMEFVPDENLVVVRATNTEIFYREWINGQIETDQESVLWRLPSQMLTPIVTSLPIGSGKTVTFEQVGSRIEFKSGRAKGKINLLDPSYYPEWDVFDPDDLKPVADLGGKVSLVEWAIDKTAPPFNGVNFNGDAVRATDKYRIATVPLAIPLDAPVTVPGGLLGSILKQTGEVMVGFTEHQMLLMPNETTQIRLVLIGSQYPAVERVMDRDMEMSVTFNKTELLEVINRVIIAAGGDRLPVMRMYFGREGINAVVKSDTSSILDGIETPGYCVHDRIEIMFTPKNIVDPISNAPNEKVTLHYNLSDNKKVYIDGGSGYEAWAVVRASTGES